MITQPYAAVLPNSGQSGSSICLSECPLLGMIKPICPDLSRRDRFDHPPVLKRVNWMSVSGRAVPNQAQGGCEACTVPVAAPLAQIADAESRDLRRETLIRLPDSHPPGGGGPGFAVCGKSRLRVSCSGWAGSGQGVVSVPGGVEQFPRSWQ